MEAINKLQILRIPFHIRIFLEFRPKNGDVINLFLQLRDPPTRLRFKNQSYEGLHGSVITAESRLPRFVVCKSTTVVLRC